MVEFEVIDLKGNNQAFTVEIEIKATRERRFFGYPVNEKWETEIDGMPKYIKDIVSKLKIEEQNKKSMKATHFKNLKKKVVGKSFK